MTSYDLILMDMQMPVLDGYDAARQLREHGYTGPIIALTAHAMTEDRDKCLAAGCNDFATKPIDREKLFAACRKWMSKSTAANEPPGNAQQLVEDDILDRDALFDKIENDLDLLKELVSLFMQNSPDLVEKAHQAILSGNAPHLVEAAHALKGSIGVFESLSAFDAAKNLEDCGRKGRLDEAANCFDRLQCELGRLNSSLATISSGQPA